MAIAATGLLCFMASARAEVRSFDGGARTAIPAVDNSNAKGGNGNGTIRPVAHYEGATRWGLAGVNPAGFFDRAAGLHRQMLAETTGSGTAVNVNDRLLAEKAFAAGQASPVTYLARLNPYGHFANTMFFLQGAANACDLNSDGTVNQADVDRAINMSLGLLTPCTANVLGAGVCNVMVVQRIINASMGGACVTGNSHSVSLSWVASTSPVAGYNVYRGTASGGPYTKLNSSLATGTSYVDTTVLAGQTYYYVVTAVDASNNSSVYSNEAQAVVPSP
ncbi:MAG: fibronectin type III domain-containing protein [Acidobacteria bacterium]|nr:fibronectin type III domain-containing protein [Acidobacteriota bacterium]